MTFSEFMEETTKFIKEEPGNELIDINDRLELIYEIRTKVVPIYKKGSNRWKQKWVQIVMEYFYKYGIDYGLDICMTASHGLFDYREKTEE